MKKSGTVIYPIRYVALFAWKGGGRRKEGSSDELEVAEYGCLFTAGSSRVAGSSLTNNRAVWSAERGGQNIPGELDPKWGEWAGAMGDKSSYEVRGCGGGGDATSPVSRQVWEPPGSAESRRHVCAAETAAAKLRREAACSWAQLDGTSQWMSHWLRRPSHRRAGLKGTTRSRASRPGFYAVIHVLKPDGRVGQLGLGGHYVCLTYRKSSVRTPRILLIELNVLLSC